VLEKSCGCVKCLSGTAMKASSGIRGSRHVRNQIELGALGPMRCMANWLDSLRGQRISLFPLGDKRAFLIGTISSFCTFSLHATKGERAHGRSLPAATFRLAGPLESDDRQELVKPRCLVVRLLIGYQARHVVSLPWKKSFYVRPSLENLRSDSTNCNM